MKPKAGALAWRHIRGKGAPATQCLSCSLGLPPGPSRQGGEAVSRCKESKMRQRARHWCPEQSPDPPLLGHLPGSRLPALLWEEGDPVAATGSQRSPPVPADSGHDVRTAGSAEDGSPHGHCADVAMPCLALRGPRLRGGGGAKCGSLDVVSDRGKYTRHEICRLNHLKGSRPHHPSPELTSPN